MLLLLANLICLAFAIPKKPYNRTADANDCKFIVGGNTYDLSALKGKSATGSDSKISTYHYMVAVCADMQQECEDIMTGQKLKGVVYQMGGEPGQQAVCWDLLAKWDGVTAGPLDASAPSGSKGLTLSFQNGDPCRGSSRKTKMNVICDASNEIGTIKGFQDDNDSCLFILQFPTKHACGGAAQWGVNGTFAGNMTCLSPDCSNNPHPTSISVNGNCDKMVAVARDDNGNAEVYNFKFDVCAGFMARGKLVPQKGGEDDALLFDMNMHLDGTVWILVNQNEFPYELEAWVELKKLSTI